MMPLSRFSRDRAHVSPAAIALVLVAGLVCSACPLAVAASAADVVPGPADSATATAHASVTVDSADVESPDAPLPDRVVVYYFHRTLRCDTCLKFEAYTSEAIADTFAAELDDGTLEWRVINLDETGNEHFVDDYYITESSVVASEFRGGEELAWTNLDAIWGCVRDKPTFLSYIQGEVAARLDRLPGPERSQSSVGDTVAPSDENPTGR